MSYKLGKEILMSTSTNSTGMLSARGALEMIKKGDITPEVVAWAEHELEKLEARNEAARKRAETKREADLPLLNSLMEALPLSEEEAMSASELGAIVGISTAKVTALMRRIIEDGAAGSVEIKSKAKSGGKCKGYFRLNPSC